MKKKSFFLFFLVLLILSFCSGIFPPVLGYADEILLLYSVSVIFGKAVFTGEADKFTLSLAVYLLYSLILSTTSEFSPNLVYAFLQSLINFKLFIIAYAGTQLYFLARVGDKVIEHTFWCFCILFAVGIAMNLILGAHWNKLFSSEIVQYRYGFLRPSGFFGHYAPNGYFASLVLITLFMLNSKKRVIEASGQVKKFFAFVFIDFMLAFPLTVRKGLFALIPYYFYTVSLLSFRKKIIFSVGSSLCILSVLAAISKTSMYVDSVSNLNNFFSDDHAYLRGLIVYHGFSLFVEFFPLGVGNGLYGTFFSNENYAVYQYVGLDPSIFIRDNGSLSAVYDSGLAALLAESGFIGFSICAYMIFLYFDLNRKLMDEFNYKIFKIIGIFSLLLSITEPVWQNGFFTTFFTSCVLYIYTKNFKYKRSGSWSFETLPRIHAR